MSGIALLGILTVLFGMGIYVSVAMGLGGLALVTIFGDRPVWDIFGYVPWNTTTSFTLVALPLFVLMGEVLLRSGVTEGMYSTLSKWLNPLPGGLLHSNIAACAMFACISGSSAATAATIGGVSLPFLKPYGYNDRIAAGSLVAGGTLGILIPPSIVFIIYGVLVEESIGKLYLAGFVPGFLMAFIVHVPDRPAGHPQPVDRTEGAGLDLARAACRPWQPAADRIPDGAGARHHLHGRRDGHRGGGIRRVRRFPDRARSIGVSACPCCARRSWPRPAPRP